MLGPCLYLITVWLHTCTSDTWRVDNEQMTSDEMLVFNAFVVQAIETVHELC